MELRGAPHDAADVVATIHPGHGIEPLEFDGAWLRACIRQPSGYRSSEPLEVQVAEGWIRWLDEERRSLVWYHTRGC